MVTCPARPAMAGTSHGGGAAADDHHALAVVVEVFGPVLRVDQAALEALHAGEVRLVAAVIVVIADAGDQKRPVNTAARRWPRHGPSRSTPSRGWTRRPRCRPGRNGSCGRRHARGRCLRCTGGWCRRRPGLESVPGAEGEAEADVGIRADAGVAEQVPGTAHGLAPLDDGEVHLRRFAHQVAAHADARESGADDQHVVMVVQGLPSFCCSCVEPVIAGFLQPARRLAGFPRARPGSACRGNGGLNREEHRE